MNSNQNHNAIYDAVRKALRKKAQQKSSQMLNKGKQYMINEIITTNTQLAQKTDKHGFDFATIPVPSLGDFSIREDGQPDNPTYSLVFNRQYMNRIDEKLEPLFAHCSQNVSTRIKNYHF